MNPLTPGVYLNLPITEYHNDPALSSTGVKLLIEDAALYWHNSALNPKREASEETPAMKFGTAYHTYILEPQRFDYAIKPGVKSTTAAGMLGEGEYNAIITMGEAIRRNPMHNALLSNGLPEVSIFWRDEETGIMCRCRVDYFGSAAWVDLKTTTSVSGENIRYAIPDYGYEISAAMYQAGAKALKQMIADGYPLPEEFPQELAEKFMAEADQLFVFLMQEKSAPYRARGLVMTPEMSSCGYDKFRKALEVYAEHRSIEGPWPSKYPAIEDLGMELVSNKINFF